MMHQPLGLPITHPSPPLSRHITVLLNEAVDALITQPDGIYVDATLGRGGHTRLLLSRLQPQASVWALDQDPDALLAVQQGGEPLKDVRLQLVHARFSEMALVLGQAGVSACDGILLDLGVSSPQLDVASRGFSFRLDGPLDMRMDPTRGQSVAEFLAQADESLIAKVIREYGEERFALQIAKAIVARRQAGGAIRTTGELAALVASVVKTREAGQNPATRTFQALRIYINAELEELEQALKVALQLLRPNARLVVISFHSLEDRRVKQFIAKHSKAVFDRRAPFAPAPPMLLQSVARIKPSLAEVQANPRARSAVMRVAQRTDTPFSDWRAA
jgi:16S rRNA (cytosine1402-N4)-methyltransferase